MSEGLHPVVQLLLARMESHPDEFVPENRDEGYILRAVEANRWWRAMSEVQEYANEQEKKAIAAKLRELRLQQAHEWAMDELCNGDERRRKERERHERDKQYYAMTQAQAQAQVYTQNMSSALNRLSGLGNYTVSQDLANNSLRIRDHDTGSMYEVPKDELEDSSTDLLYKFRKAIGI